MMTFRQLAAEPPTLPTRTTWYLTDLAGARGKQELSTRQSPQKLKVLREHALIESAVSSNRISLERLIEQNKERYYEVLEQSSAGWHEGKHDPWPAMNFLLFILAQACKEFEQRLGQLKAPRGEKTAIVENAISRRTGPFSLADLQQACPGVSVDLIRSVLKRLKGTAVECLGRGHTAKWRRKGK